MMNLKNYQIAAICYFLESLSLECCQDSPRYEQVENRKFRWFDNFGDSSLVCLFIETCLGFVLPVITTRFS